VAGLVAVALEVAGLVALVGPVVVRCLPVAEPPVGIQVPPEQLLPQVAPVP